MLLLAPAGALQPAPRRGGGKSNRSTRDAARRRRRGSTRQTSCRIACAVASVLPTVARAHAATLQRSMRSAGRFRRSTLVERAAARFIRHSCAYSAHSASARRAAAAAAESRGSHPHEPALSAASRARTHTRCAGEPAPSAAGAAAGAASTTARRTKGPGEPCVEEVFVVLPRGFAPGGWPGQPIPVTALRWARVLERARLLECQCNLLQCNLLHI